AESSGNTREIGPATTGSIDNMVAPENQPAAVGPSKAAQRASPPRASVPAMPAAGLAVPKQAGPRAAVTAPAPRLTIAAEPPRPLVYPWPLPRPDQAKRAARTTQLQRTMSIWPPYLRRVVPPPLPSRPVAMRFKLPPSAVTTGLKARFARCKRNTRTSLAA